MGTPVVTSVADGIPFDPTIPSSSPADLGFSFGWNPVTGTWESRDITVYHRQAAIPDQITISAGGSLTLTPNGNAAQVLYGSGAGFSVSMPDASQLVVGEKYEIYNTTMNTVLFKDYTGTTLFTLAQNSVAYLYLAADTTQAGTWICWQVLISSVATGIINYNIASTTPFATNSNTYVAISSFTLTPQAGTYGVWFNASAQCSTGNASTSMALYKAGTVIADSVRDGNSGGSGVPLTIGSQSIVTFTGSEAIDVRVRTTGGTYTINQRSLLLIRLGT